MIRPGGVLCAVLCLAVSIHAQEPAAAGPAALRVDNLSAPLGMDDAAPKFSWQLHDGARGALASDRRAGSDRSRGDGSNR